MNPFHRSIMVMLGFVLAISACAPAQAIQPAQTQAGNPTESKPVAATEAQPTNTAEADPAWVTMDLTDVKTGKVFKISDFKGKVIMIESMAIWCPNCLREGKHMKELQTIYGRDDLVVVTLDIDLHEDPDMLKSYAQQNGFDWAFVVAPLPMMRDIGNLYGARFMDPTLSPTLVINRKSEIYKMGFGEKMTDGLVKAIDPFIKANN
jgi:thiol-disulfide isomerase/thioredoxin